MDRNKVLEVFSAYTDTVGDFDAYGAATAIAQAAEEDLAQLNRGWRASECARLRTIAALQAQVAVMAEALESLTVFCDRKHIADKLWEANSISGGTIGELTILLSSAHEALSAAPKVVWSGEAVMGWDGTMPELLLSGDIHTIPLVAGDIHNVIVLAHDQGQECSVKEGCKGRHER